MDSQHHIFWHDPCSQQGMTKWKEEATVADQGLGKVDVALFNRNQHFCKGFLPADSDRLSTRPSVVCSTEACPSWLIYTEDDIIFTRAYGVNLCSSGSECMDSGPLRQLYVGVWVHAYTHGSKGACVFWKGCGYCSERESLHLLQSQGKIRMK